MKKGTHIHTDFIKFIIEKYSKPELIEVDEDEVDTIVDNPQDDEEFNDSENINDDKDDEDDEVLEKLLTEFKKIKRKYENRRI